MPHNLDFMRWAHQVRLDLPNMNIPIPISEKEWKLWARQIINSNVIKNAPLPTDLSYSNPEDWRKWAIFFVGSVLNS